MLLYPGVKNNHKFKDFENSNDPYFHECKLGFVSVLSEDSKLDPDMEKNYEGSRIDSVK